MRYMKRDMDNVYKLLREREFAIAIINNLFRNRNNF